MAKVFDNTKLGRAAIVVIDMQHDFVDKGAPIECVDGRTCIAPINSLIAQARVASRPIIFTQEAHRASGIDFGRELDYDEPAHCYEGSLGVEIIPQLDRRQSDYLIVKRRYSAFFATDLDILLRGLGVDTLILTGVATDVCVRATAQDAQQHDYHVVVPQECVAGTSIPAHAAALANIGYIFGHVVSLPQVLDGLPARAERAPLPLLRRQM